MRIKYRFQYCRLGSTADNNAGVSCVCQVHTTGIDVRQAPGVRAAITLGKDMTWRDFTQGAWRMRGLEAGQRLGIRRPGTLPRGRRSSLRRQQQHRNVRSGLDESDKRNRLASYRWPRRRALVVPRPLLPRREDVPLPRPLELD